MTYALPVLYTLFVWWFSTGLILYLDGLPRRTYRYTLTGATVLMGLGLYGLHATSGDTTVTGAYLAFTSGVLVWAWQEVAFLMGFVTGPRRSRCRPGCSGWPHFVHAVEAILYHELALIASGVAVLALTWNGANQVGAWTFLILWAMRESAKLNLFLGVRNLNEEFLPPHMQFLRGFLTKRPMNLLFPVSITASTAVAVLMITEAAAPWASSFDAVGLTLAATMLVLAIVEHWLLVLPLPTDMLWSWGMRSREGEHHHSRRDRGSDPPLATDLVEPIRVKRA